MEAKISSETLIIA